MKEKFSKREKEIKKVLLITLFLNLFVAFIKILAGKKFNFLSLSTSGLESIFDGSSNILALISIFLAYRPADKGHSFGHYKYETLGSFVIAILLIFSAFQVNIDFNSIWEKREIRQSFSMIPIFTILISMAVSLFVTLYESRKSKELGSAILEADAEHTMGDFIISFGVLSSIILSYFGYRWPDVIIGALIAVYLFYLAFKIFRENLPNLLDASPDIQINLIKSIEEIDEVRDIHRFRARGNKSFMYIDFHLHLEPTLSLVAAHKIGHRAEEKLRDLLKNESKVIDILVHIEPFDENHKHPGEENGR